MRDGYHLSLSLGRSLWEDLLRASLPIDIAGGRFDLAQNARAVVRRIGVRERIAGVLEDRRPPRALLRVRDRARTAWHHRRDAMYRRMDQVLRVEGTWEVVLDDMGTNLRYGRQQVQADAFLKGVATGTVYLLRDNVELPFTLEKRVGASLTLGDIRYDPGHRAVIGSLQDLAVHFGDNAVYQLLSRLAELGLDRQLGTVNPVPILRRDQVEDLVAPMGGAFKMRMGVEHLELSVDESEMTLRVRFGFTQPQLTDQAG